MVMPFYHFSQFLLSNFILMNLILKIKSKLLVIGGNYRQLHRWNTIISIIFFLLFTFWPIRIWKLSSRLPSKWSHVYSSYAAKVYILSSLFWRIWFWQRGRDIPKTVTKLALFFIYSREAILSQHMTLYLILLLLI